MLDHGHENPHRVQAIHENSVSNHESQPFLATATVRAKVGAPAAAWRAFVVRW
jgi:hypothetical protein